jgi:hypothetical protein
MEPMLSNSLTDFTSGEFLSLLLCLCSLQCLYLYSFIWQVFEGSCDMNCIVIASYYFVKMEHESDSDSHDDEVEDMSVDESGSDDASVSEVEIRDSGSGSSVDIQQA